MFILRFGLDLFLLQFVVVIRLLILYIFSKDNYKGQFRFCYYRVIVSLQTSAVQNSKRQYSHIIVYEYSVVNEHDVKTNK